MYVYVCLYFAEPAPARNPRYTFYGGKFANFSRSVDICRGLKGNLAKPKSQADIDEINKVNKGYVHLGMTRIGPDGIFHWYDDYTEVTWFNWHPSYGKAKQWGCAAIKTSGLMYDLPCASSHKVLCDLRPRGMLIY